jgi:hypothetical protein
MEINLVTRSGGHNLRVGNNLVSLKKLAAVAEIISDMIPHATVDFFHTSFDEAISDNFLKVIHPCYKQSVSITNDHDQLKQLLSRFIVTTPSANNKLKTSRYDFGNSNFTIFHDLAGVTHGELTDAICILASKSYLSITVILNDLFPLNCAGIEDRLLPFERLIELPQNLVKNYNILKDYLGESPLIGIHMRKTDYRKWQNGKHFLEDAYYLKIVNCIKTSFVDIKPKFLFVSDEAIDSVEIQRLSSSNEVFDFIKDESLHPDLMDLVALSFCDLILGPISTYSAFASDFREVSRMSCSNMPRLFSRSRIILTGDFDADQYKIKNVRLA